MSKGRGRNGMSSVGGQRKKLSRRELRGGPARGAGAGGDPAAEKKELLRKMRERADERGDSERDA
ncbi:DUF6243 family protein [Actinomadura bangladeshensis]|uniref:Uncharacterized protein n=1 Tax=Actinomadura bangladeshensis TaxID=453573 RepID=A0A4R4NYW2_9ACTN|nr:DUF6243 family protein [Actinomadura bangladeshensis]TDC14785.1 hypothetical protein E1284_17310 [Actinomadura bangladeshensis]